MPGVFVPTVYPGPAAPDVHMRVPLGRKDTGDGRFVNTPLPPFLEANRDQGPPGPEPFTSLSP